MDNPVDTLVSTLRNRSIRVSSDIIDSAFANDSKHAENAQWAMEHLGQDTLLSQEELNLYSKIENSNTLRSIIHSPDIVAIRPFHDENLRKSIEQLNASTAAVRDQVAILSAEYENLNNKLHDEQYRRLRSAKDIERLRLKHESGRQNTTTAYTDLYHGLGHDLRMETDKATGQSKGMLLSLSAQLKEDDKILAVLEKMVSTVNSTAHDASIIKHTSELGVRLSTYIAEEIQYRLDRLYLECILSEQVDISIEPSNFRDEALLALEEELDSLYPEIDVLAIVSSNQQFSEPILRELQENQGQQRIASHQKLDYNLDLVTEITSSTESLTKNMLDRESLCGALEALTTIYLSEVGDRLSEQNPSRLETLKRRSAPLSAFPDLEKQMSSTVKSPALAGLLRRLGVCFESVFHTKKEDSGVKALSEQRRHMLGCLRSYDIAADSSLRAELSPIDQANQLFLSSLDSSSQFKTSLSGVDEETRLALLESHLGHLQKGIGGLNLDVLYRRDKSQEKFIDRWT